ncbi:hypothetical protein D3C74_149790 [compost metagenome]
MASMQKRGENSWFFVINVGYRPDGTRDRRTKTVKVEDPAILKSPINRFVETNCFSNLIIVTPNLMVFLNVAMYSTRFNTLSRLVFDSSKFRKEYEDGIALKRGKEKENPMHRHRIDLLDSFQLSLLLDGSCREQFDDSVLIFQDRFHFHHTFIRIQNSSFN